MNAAERSTIAGRAYVPEHLPAYVAAITGGQPHLIGDFVAYTAADRLIFVGYPLSGWPQSAGAGRLRNGSSDFQSPGFQSPDAPAPWQTALDAALTRFRPRLVSITAATLPPGLSDCAPSPPDAYYRLDLADVRPDKKLRNLLRRAERAVTVGQAPALGPEHRALVAEFLADTPVDDGTRYICERLGRYAGARKPGDWKSLLRLRSLPAQTASADQPLILEARDAGGRLVAFDIAAFGGEVAFYLFNFRAGTCYVPGASDLLLARLIAEGQARGKRTLNLGLGINAGVRHFKEKWGAEPFLPHVACVWEQKINAWEETLSRL